MSNWCKHYTGAGRHDECKAGICYKDVRVVNPGHGNGVSYPCTPNMNESGAKCSSLEFYTPEEIAQQERETGEYVELILSGISPCCKAEIDKSHLIPSGRYKGHGKAYCSKCRRCIGVI